MREEEEKKINREGGKEVRMERRRVPATERERQKDGGRGDKREKKTIKGRHGQRRKAGMMNK